MTDPYSPRPYEPSQPSQSYGTAQPYVSSAQGDPWQPSVPAPYTTPNAMPGGPAGPPKSNVGWAVASLVFFWPLAFAAFTHALEVYPAWARGDIARAVYSSERARKLGLWALAIWAVIFVVMIVGYVALIAAAVSATSSW